MDPIGVIFGRVGPDGFNMAVAAPSVQRNEYVQANHKMYGSVVGQVLSLERMDRRLVEAATDLYASRWTALRAVIRLTPNSRQRAASEGSGSPGFSAAMRARSASSISR